MKGYITMETENTKTDAFFEAGKRTAKTVAEASLRWVKRVQAVVDRHPGVATGGSLGYPFGRQMERVPGVPGRLPRYMGSIAGAAVGCVFEKAYNEVTAEQQAAEASPGGMADDQQPLC